MRALLYLLLRRNWWAWKGHPAYRIASLLDESQWWPREKIEEFRNAKLLRLIEHSYQYVPYYRRVMQHTGLRPRDIQSAADLSKLPVLTKDIVRKNWSDLRAANFPDKNIFVSSSGGTTGEPMRIAKPFESDAWTTMCFERGLSWGGLLPGTKRVHLTGGSVGASSRSGLQRAIDRLSGRINLLAY